VLVIFCSILPLARVVTAQADCDDGLHAGLQIIHKALIVKIANLTPIPPPDNPLNARTDDDQPRSEQNHHRPAVVDDHWT
jgi:hypothetical protein